MSHSHHNHYEASCRTTQVYNDSECVVLSCLSLLYVGHCFQETTSLHLLLFQLLMKELIDPQLPKTGEGLCLHFWVQFCSMYGRSGVIVGQSQNAWEQPPPLLRAVEIRSFYMIGWGKMVFLGIHFFRAVSLAEKLT